LTKKRAATSVEGFSPTLALEGSLESRQCPFCGTIVASDAQSCYHCRENLPQHAAHARNPAAGHYEIRRGALYMILAAVVHYALGRVVELNLPFEVPSFLTEYLTPFLILCGIGLFLYGWILKLKG